MIPVGLRLKGPSSMYNVCSVHRGGYHEYKCVARFTKNFLPKIAPTVSRLYAREVLEPDMRHKVIVKLFREQ